MAKENATKVKEDDEKITIKDVLSILLYMVVVVIITFGIVKFVGQRTVVSGASMENTLNDGDNLIVDKISYRLHDPKRFDVIVFPYQYEEKTYYIKRIIGLPGETVYIDDFGNIYIDGELLEESYGKDVIADPGNACEPIKLADDEYFVLGDNRNNSYDSRFDLVGPIDRDIIIGKAWVRIFPFNKIGKIN